MQTLKPHKFPIEYQEITVGSNVKFLGFVMPAHDNPPIAVGEVGRVIELLPYDGSGLEVVVQFSWGEFSFSMFELSIASD